MPKYRPKKFTKLLSVYVLPEIGDALRDLADIEERSQQYFMRRALRELLVKRGYKFTTRKKGARR